MKKSLILMPLFAAMLCSCGGGGTTSSTTSGTTTPTSTSTSTSTPSGPQVVKTAPVAGTKYMIGIDHTGLEKRLYLDGTTGSKTPWYLNTVEAQASAAEVTVEVVEGGYNIKVGTKYVVCEESEKSSGGFTCSSFYEDEAGAVWEWDEENYSFLCEVDVDGTVGHYYLGTDPNKTYQTLGAVNNDKYPDDIHFHFYK